MGQEPGEGIPEGPSLFPVGIAQVGVVRSALGQSLIHIEPVGVGAVSSVSIGVIGSVSSGLALSLVNIETLGVCTVSWAQHCLV